MNSASPGIDGNCVSMVLGQVGSAKITMTSCKHYLSATARIYRSTSINQYPFNASIGPFGQYSKLCNVCTGKAKLVC